jgi:Cyclic nucleotide-binding domain
VSWFIHQRLLEPIGFVRPAQAEVHKYRPPKSGAALSSCAYTSDGKQVIFSLVAPDDWFGDIPMIDGLGRTHDAQACADTTLLVMRRSDLARLSACVIGSGDIRAVCGDARIMKQSRSTVA